MCEKVRSPTAGTRAGNFGTDRQKATVLVTVLTGATPGECVGGSGTRTRLSPGTEQCARSMAAVREILKDVDETLCDHALCQHPLCWETMRRLERRLPRRKLQSVPKIPPENEGELPALSILELPQWSADQSVCVSNLHVTSEKTATSSRTYGQAHPGSTYTISMMGCSLGNSLDSLQFSRSRSCSPTTRGSSATLKKVYVMEVKQQPSSCDQYLGNTMLFWVPNPSYNRKWQKKRAQSIISAQHVTVQKISFQGQPYDQKQSQKMKKKARNNVPTGGQPYTFLARQQQILKRWGEKTQSMDGEHGSLLPQIAQPNQSGCEGSRKIPAYIMPAAVNKKFALRNLNGKQQQVLSTIHYRMDQQFLEGKRMNIINLGTVKRQKYLHHNLSASQNKTGSECQLSPVSSAKVECTQQSPYLFGREVEMVSTHDPNLHDSVQHTDVKLDNPAIPGISLVNLLCTPSMDVKIEMKTWLPLVDEGLLEAAETDAERSLSLNVLAHPGDQMQIAKGIKEQDLSTAIEMRSQGVEQTGSEDQNSLSIAERNEQKDLSTAIEMGSPVAEEAGSEDQSSLQIAKRNEQEDLSIAIEIEFPIAEEPGSEDQSNLQIAKRNEQEDLSIATESSAVILEQQNCERSEDHQNGSVIVQSVEEQDTARPNERAISHVGEMDQGGPEI
ncbi:uncharacterized protein [Heterodontus francisci]|uniref:uncharacterized protein n=1 Tax=Heterodontus francisci TaxID=7792 RepID=UPI00355B6AE9